MNDLNSSNNFKSGFVTIIGRPNAGKSTLLNSILNKKVSITSPKAQTTRNNIHGIKTTDDTQMVFIDTPGLHLKAKLALNKAMNQAALDSLKDIDVIVWVIEALKWTNEDELVLSNIQNINKPVILAINKTDLIKNKTKLLPFITKVKSFYNFASISLISAKNQDNLNLLETEIKSYLTDTQQYYPENQISNRTDNFHIAEFVREKIMLLVSQEIPYGATVEVESAKLDNKTKQINALIWVTSDSHKKIIIGKSGSLLKQIGISARLELERYLNAKVCLKLWVKVKSSWNDDVRALTSLGLIEG